jgi:RNA polymerase sigma factor (sigma-70 family)
MSVSKKRQSYTPEYKREAAKMVVVVDSSRPVATVAREQALRLLEHLPQLREPSALPGWIATTTRRECLRRLRAAGREVPAELADLVNLVDADAPDIDRDLLATENRAELEAALAELTSRERDLLRMVASDPPLSYAQIGKRLGIPVGSIDPIRTRALKRRPPTVGADGPGLSVSRSSITTRR